MPPDVANLPALSRSPIPRAPSVAAARSVSNPCKVTNPMIAIIKRFMGFLAISFAGYGTAVAAPSPIGVWIDHTGRGAVRRNARLRTTRQKVIRALAAGCAEVLTGRPTK